MIWSAETIREKIAAALPPGIVITEHTDKGHFYRIMTPDKKGKVGNVYPSVTGKLQLLKDESLINYKKNQVIQYVFANYSKFTDANIMEHLALAERVPEDVLADAGDIGNEIHGIRESIFADWIKMGSMPGDFLSYIKPEQVDPRIKSGVRGLHKFVTDHSYVPVATELFVYSHKLRVAGTLDDIGLMRKTLQEGSKDCPHANVVGTEKKNVCLACGWEWRNEFVLLDLKTSNQFKDHYFFQVAMYFLMFRELVGITPERCFILRVSKEDGTYKLEDLKRPAMLGSYARSMIRTSNGIEFIKSLRKDNQKKVAPIIKL
jgi:hypothetical protein